jgi:hypothetical protein
VFGLILGTLGTVWLLVLSGRLVLSVVAGFGIALGVSVVGGLIKLVQMRLSPGSNEAGAIRSPAYLRTRKSATMERCPSSRG